MTDLRYPIGPFKAHAKDRTTDGEKAALIHEVAAAPARLLLQIYAWHGKHHVAHITSLREREGW